MNRRNTIKGLAAGTIGILVFGYWVKCSNIFDKTTNTIPTTIFSNNEQSTLSAIVDTIIPKGNDIGALDVGTDKFLEKLFEKCYESDIQDNIKTQLVAVDTSAKNKYSKLFSECSQEEREELLLTLSISENEDEKKFFDLIKAQTIRGFKTTKEVMLGYLNYEIAPGRYNGCVDVNTVS